MYEAAKKRKASGCKQNIKKKRLNCKEVSSQSKGEEGSKRGAKRREKGRETGRRNQEERREAKRNKEEED